MNARLEAFSDGVFAIALTLLIIDVRLPELGANPSVPALWSALGRLGPVAFAFLLSFAVILITWINHHNTLRLVNRNSAAFMYANGLMLLGVVCIPFVTKLLGVYLSTAAAAPAVVLYATNLTAQAVSWVAVTGVALRDGLAVNEAAAVELRKARAKGVGAMGLYAALAVLALWLPRTVAIITALTWLLWLVLSLRPNGPESIAD